MNYIEKLLRYVRRGMNTHGRKAIAKPKIHAGTISILFSGTGFCTSINVIAAGTNSTNNVRNRNLTINVFSR